MSTVLGRKFEFLKPLIILEDLFPLVAEGDAELLPENILLNKTKKGFNRERAIFRVS